METETQQEDVFHFDINIQGPEFQNDKASLSATLEILEGYKDSFNSCLEIATKHFAPQTKITIPPSIKLQSARTGSLEVSTVVDMIGSIGPAAATISPYLPEMVQYAWQLYQKSHKFISAAVNFFTERGTPVTINIDNSPGAVNIVNIGNGSITVSPDVLNASRHIHHSLEKMAKPISQRSADSITITAPDEFEEFEPDVRRIAFHRDNENLFSVKSTETLDHDAIPLLCGIYSLNTRSLKGKLELLEDTESRIIPFTVSDDTILNECVDGLKATKSRIYAIREMQKNALGETKIKRIYITGIENIFDKKE